jgi:hypothetical protein
MSVTFENPFGFANFAANQALADTGNYDQRYQNATSDFERQVIVGQRDAANARIAAENDAWHKARGTGPYAAGGGGGGGGTDAASAAAAAAESRRVNQALAEAKTFFDSNGMSELWSGVEGLVRQGYNDADTISGILSRDPGYQAAYYRRFPGVERIRAENQRRIADGKPPVPEPSPATYVALEQGYARALSGLPTNQFGTKEDIAQFIANQVSPEEVGSRVTQAKNYINYQANASVKNQLRSIYGLTDTEMVAYVLDESRTKDFIETEYAKRLRQASVGAAAIDAGVTIGADLRNTIAGSDAYGGSYSNALSGFQNVAQQADAYSKLGQMSGISTTTEELVNEQFGAQGAADVANKKKNLASQERARFGGSSGIAQNSLNARALGSTY